MASSSNITNKVINNLGTTEVELITTGANQKAACVGLSFANLTHRIAQQSPDLVFQIQRNFEEEVAHQNDFVEVYESVAK